MKKNFITQVLLLCALLLQFVFFTDEVKSEECLSYKPAKVKLTGTLVSRTFPGPPNYESIEKGDEPETYWILKLTKPICVNGNPKDEINNATVNDVMLIQLVFLGEGNEYNRYRDLLSKKVGVTGSLFLGHTGHHHTDILIDVKDIKPFFGKIKEGSK